MTTPVRTTYLEMTDAAQLRPATAQRAEFAIVRAEVPSPELSRFLYTAVGGDWHWTERIEWTYAEWRTYLDRAEVETWVGCVQGTPAGYFELERQEKDGRRDVEIVYFGLLPSFIGAGYGGILLTRAIQRAWAMGADRVWVHTCTLDGPAALENYRARGMRVYQETERVLTLPEVPVGPWPGCRT